MSKVFVDPLASLDVFGQQRISTTGALPNEVFQHMNVRIQEKIGLVNLGFLVVIPEYTKRGWQDAACAKHPLYVYSIDHVS